MYDDENSYFSKPDDRGVRYYQSENGQGVQVMKRKEKSGSLRNSLIVLVCILAGLAILGVSCNNMMQSGEQEIKLPSSKYIATVYIEGVISMGNYDSWGFPYGYQHNWTLNEIDRLIYDSNNKGMILYVDSPGGGVYESDELYFKIKEYKETGKPVYVSMASMAASGGYYISAPANKIYANRNCWTGSLGVTIGTLVDVSGFLDQYGIKTTTISSGRNKSMGNYFEPLTREQNDILQALVDEAYDQFTNIVADERGMDIARVEEIADGRIYTAKQALELELIDAVGTYDDAIADMERQYQLAGCEIVDIYYVHKSFLASLLRNANLGNIGARGDAAAVLGLLEKQNRFPVSYLCDILAN